MFKEELAAIKDANRRDFEKLGMEAVAVVRANGFDPVTRENTITKLMLVLTEVVEVLEIDPGLSEEDLEAEVEEEMADVLIRLAGIIFEAYPPNLVRPSTVKLKKDPYNPTDGQSSFGLTMLTLAAWATEHWRYDEHVIVAAYLWRMVDVVIRVCDDGLNNVNWRRGMAEKTKKNATRGHLHGKKQSVG